MNFGCTAFPGDVNRSYPFATAHPTVLIEGTAVNNRYLRDVIPQETGPAAYHETALRAQAIAARTYAYWFVQHPMSTNPAYHINNSAAKQVFVPYKFDTLTTGQQTIVNNALQDRYYLSQASDDNPIFSEFFADIPLRTITNTGYSYLVQVEDPINSHPDVVQDGHGHGLSQKGASRWVRGNLSYNINTDLGAWSVSWPERFQLLTHYYTGIHVRDAANGNAIVTPTWRGAALQVAWARPRSYPDGICSRIEVWLQNSGTSPWYGADQGYLGQQIGPGYCWNGACTPTGYLPRTVAPGQDLRLTVLLPPWSGSGELRLDLYHRLWNEPQPTWFGPTWPRQYVGTFSAVPGHCARLPLLKKHEPIY
jgi:hypothetical protein